MIRNTILQLPIYLLLCAGILPGTVMSAGESDALETPDNHVNSIFHVGLWVENLDEMLAFLAANMDVKIVTRAERAAGGERVILSDARGQLIELLSDPGNVVPHPDFPLHPTGRVAGIAHIAIYADDVSAIKTRMLKSGYEILSQVPEDFKDGYIAVESKKYRILFVRGPGAVTFEFFEIKN